MVSVSDRQRAVGELMADLTARHRQVDRANTRRIFAAFGCWLICVTVSIVVAGFHLRLVAAVVFVVSTASYFYVYFVLITSWTNAYSLRIGFVCPHCSKPLYVREDGARGGHKHFLKTAECPHCFQRVEPTI